MGMNQENSFSLVKDIYLLSALLTYDPNLKFCPRMGVNGKVFFEVRGQIADKIERLHSGEAAPLDLFISNLKKLHSTIFDMKNRRMED
jgi:hypothetical protein